ncbi:MAG: DUF1819 family protein [Anaerolineaceae bacterium]|nr:DUF1819 family protein [Anaerolineaceae bacterium]
MPYKEYPSLKRDAAYSAVITREQFLFYETRTTARLLCEGKSEEEIIQQIIDGNLFQYPTEKMVKRMAKTCLRRLDALQDEILVHAIAAQPVDTARQICLFAMMCQYKLVWDFMITVIGEKYRKFDNSFSKMDLNVFFMRLQEQDNGAAAWSDATITKIKQVLQKLLVDNEYLDNTKADHINPVLISPVLENAIRDAGQEIALSAFNCLS